MSAVEPPLGGLADDPSRPSPERPRTVGRTLVRSTLSYLPSRIVPAAVGVVTIPLVATQLDPAGFGTFALVAAALPFLAVVSADWVIAGHQRYAHADRSPQATVWVALLGTGWAICLLATWLVTRELAVLALALLLPPFLLLRLQSIDLQMTGRATRFSLHNCTYSILRGALLVLAAYATGEVAWIFAGWVAASIVTVLVGPRLALRARPRLARLRALGQVGVPLVAASLALNASATADRFIIAAIEGRAQTGVYYFGYVIGETLIALPLSLPFLAAQYMATRRWDRGDHEGTIAFLHKVLLMQTAVGTLVVLGLSASAGSVFRTYGPDQYASAERVLVVVGAAQLLASVTPYLLVVAALKNQTRRVIIPSAITAAANLGLTSAAVTLAGIEGAAIATAATYGILCILLQRSLKTRLLDRSSTVIIVVVTVSASCSVFTTGDVRLSFLLLLCIASLTQCARALRRF